MASHMGRNKADWDYIQASFPLDGTSDCRIRTSMFAPQDDWDAIPVALDMFPFANDETSIGKIVLYDADRLADLLPVVSQWVRRHAVTSTGRSVLPSGDVLVHVRMPSPNAGTEPHSVVLCCDEEDADHLTHCLVAEMRRTLRPMLPSHPVTEASQLSLLEQIRLILTDDANGSVDLCVDGQNGEAVALGSDQSIVRRLLSPNAISSTFSSVDVLGLTDLCAMQQEAHDSVRSMDGYGRSWKLILRYADNLEIRQKGIGNPPRGMRILADRLRGMTAA